MPSCWVMKKAGYPSTFVRDKDTVVLPCLYARWQPIMLRGMSLYDRLISSGMNTDTIESRFHSGARQGRNGKDKDSDG